MNEPLAVSDQPRHETVANTQHAVMECGCLLVCWGREPIKLLRASGVQWSAVQKSTQECRRRTAVSACTNIA